MVSMSYFPLLWRAIKAWVLVLEMVDGVEESQVRYGNRVIGSLVQHNNIIYVSCIIVAYSVLRY
jgi:hypothetical protein